MFQWNSSQNAISETLRGGGGGAAFGVLKLGVHMICCNLPAVTKFVALPISATFRKYTLSFVVVVVVVVVVNVIVIVLLGSKANRSISIFLV